MYNISYSIPKDSMLMISCQYRGRPVRPLLLHPLQQQPDHHLEPRRQSPGHYRRHPGHGAGQGLARPAAQGRQLLLQAPRGAPGLRRGAGQGERGGRGQKVRAGGEGARRGRGREGGGGAGRQDRDGQGLGRRGGARGGGGGRAGDGGAAEGRLDASGVSGRERG